MLVWKPAKKAVLGALDGRAEKIRNDLDEAQRLHEEAKALLAKYQRQLHEGEALAAEIVAQGEAQRQRFEEKMRADFDLAVKRRTDLAMERIAQEEARALQEVRSRAADLAIRATRRLLDDKVGRRRGAEPDPRRDRGRQAQAGVTGYSAGTRSVCEKSLPLNSSGSLRILGQGIGKAVAVVQPGRMATTAIRCESVRGHAGQFGRHRDDLDLDLVQGGIDQLAADLAATARNYCYLDIVGRRHDGTAMFPDALGECTAPPPRATGSRRWPSCRPPSDRQPVLVIGQDLVDRARILDR